MTAPRHARKVPPHKGLNNRTSKSPELDYWPVNPDHHDKLADDLAVLAWKLFEELSEAEQETVVKRWWRLLPLEEQSLFMRDPGFIFAAEKHLLGGQLDAHLSRLLARRGRRDGSTSERESKRLRNRWKNSIIDYAIRLQSAHPYWSKSQALRHACDVGETGWFEALRKRYRGIIEGAQKAGIFPKDWPPDKQGDH